MPLSSPTRISIALCTYNGEPYLSQQLASIVQQTRLPDEMVILDDCSTDGTPAIIRDFAWSAPFPVVVVENEQNLGSTRNFEKAMRLCSGELIALSDQDDVWHRTRLERCEHELRTHPQAGLVFSDGEMIDEQGRAMGRRIWEAALCSMARMAELSAGDYDLLLEYRFVTGATVMFRSALRDRFLPIPPQWVHDEWMAAMSLAFAELAAIEEPLISYRRHVSQQVGLSSQAPPRRPFQDHWNALRFAERTKPYWNRISRHVSFAQAICERLSTFPLEERGRNVLAAYEGWLRFASFRLNMPRRRLSRLAPVLGRYRLYSRHALGLQSVLKDLVRTLPPIGA